MKTVYVEVAVPVTDESLKRTVVRHKARTGAFYAELQEVADYKGRFHPVIAFYVTEKPERLTPGKKRKMLESIKPTYKASAPFGTDVELSGEEVILYGERPDSDASVWEYLDKNHLSVVCVFNDEDAGTEACDYSRFQQALFFAGRRRLPVLITASERLLDDIRPLNLLSEANIRFYGMDFPWFNHFNLELFRALALYKGR